MYLKIIPSWDGPNCGYHNSVYHNDERVMPKNTLDVKKFNRDKIIFFNQHNIDYSDMDMIANFKNW